MKTTYRWLVIFASLSACADPAPTAIELAGINEQAHSMAVDLAELTVNARDRVVVRLAFSPEVDLDLYVTDPLMDTVYFARHQSRTGGKITTDIRCDSAALTNNNLRIEEVRFEQLWPGRYRVGVDFPRRCDDRPSTEPAAYAVKVDVNDQTFTTDGLVNLEFFEVVVLDFDVEL